MANGRCKSNRVFFHLPFAIQDGFFNILSGLRPAQERLRVDAADLTGGDAGRQRNRHDHHGEHRRIGRAVVGATPKSSPRMARPAAMAAARPSATPAATRHPARIRTLPRIAGRDAPRAIRIASSRPRRATRSIGPQPGTHPDKVARNRSAVRPGMNRYAPALTLTKRGSGAVRGRSVRRGIVMWLVG